VAQEDGGEAPRELGRHLREVELRSRSGGKLYREAIAEIVVKLLQGFDEQVVDGEPDRPAPVGIAAEEAAGRLGGLVPHAVAVAVELQHVWLVLVHSRE